MPVISWELRLGQTVENQVTRWTVVPVRRLSGFLHGVAGLRLQTAMQGRYGAEKSEAKDEARNWSLSAASSGPRTPRTQNPGKLGQELCSLPRQQCRVGPRRRVGGQKARLAIGRFRWPAPDLGHKIPEN